MDTNPTARMPESLNTFLTTGKNKRIAAHKHVCATLGLEADGKAETVRKRILTYVNGSSEKEAEVKLLVTGFIKGEAEKAPNSQVDLFSQQTDISDDELEETAPCSLEDDDDEDAISFIEKSFSTLCIKDKDTTILPQQQVDAITNKNTPNTTEKPPCCEFSFMTLEAKKIIACKDSQIETLEHYLSVKETQISRLEDMNRILFNKLDNVTQTLIASNSDLTDFKDEIKTKLSSIEGQLSTPQQQQQKCSVQQNNGQKDPQPVAPTATITQTPTATPTSAATPAAATSSNNNSSNNDSINNSTNSNNSPVSAPP